MARDGECWLEVGVVCALLLHWAHGTSLVVGADVHLRDAIRDGRGVVRYGSHQVGSRRLVEVIVARYIGSAEVGLILCHVVLTGRWWC